MAGIIIDSCSIDEYQSSVLNSVLSQGLIHQFACE